MRLLNVHDFTFREFNSASVPTYVIVSHRWDENNEVTIADVRERRNIQKVGYKKVENCARYVKETIPMIDWLWIDTCCIDQDSDREVSEAVNSMFRWYCDAELCIVYLADVVAADDEHSFQRSVWFSRGWTLQELLAPRIVVFLTQKWQLIGRKGGDGRSKSGIPLQAGRALDATIATVTGIPEVVLRDHTQIQHIPLEQKLGWMAGRQTTREEDMSYCLLGLFDITMPITYGEGYRRARERLRAEIYKNGPEKIELAKLKIAQGAEYNSLEKDGLSYCLEGTRTELLDRVVQWANNPESKCIFWLCGKAGTGKSTIARTLAILFDNQQRLGASFFFRRGEGDRGNASCFFPTIANQLVYKIQGFGQHVADALKTDSAICEKSLQHQFEELVLQPLVYAALLVQQSYGIIIIIDALDECTRDTDIRMILTLLARLQTVSSFRFRIFVTSRPELPIRSSFRKMNGELHEDVILEEAQAGTIEHDIRAYFEHRFTEIADENELSGTYDPLPVDWPGDNTIQQLVHLADPHFVFASTVCRFISEGSPRERLNTILQRENRNSFSELEKTYLQILNLSVLRRNTQNFKNKIEQFRELVGPIALLTVPLSARSLSSLLKIQLIDVSETLKDLHSVLDIPSDPNRPIRPLHLSFRDFLVDERGKGTNRFWIDKTRTHSRLATRCLQLLTQQGRLKRDLLGLEKPGTRRAEVRQQQVATSISPEVEYACCYWTWHLIEGEEKTYDDGLVHKFLSSHVLCWLEALSWLGRLSNAVAYISDIESAVQVDYGSQLLAFLDDLRRFLLRHRYIVDLAPLQLYYSALTFTPSQSIVKKLFYNGAKEWLSVLPAVALYWDAELQKLEGHDDGVTAVTFSPDGQTIASGSHDRTIRLWDAKTGEEKQKLEGHDNEVTAVTFSPDGQTIASGSWDRTIRLWEAKTGKEKQKLEGHDDGVTAVMFSSDGQTIASGSSDWTVRLWDTKTGKEKQKLEGHDDGVTAVTFSPDGQTIASGSWDLTVRLWEATTGKEKQKLNRHDRWVTAVAFSPDGQTIASGSHDRTIRLWDAKTGKERQKLEGHDDGVTAVKFSPDGQTIASGSWDRTIRLWEATTGEMKQQRLECHDREITAVAFSPEGQAIVSVSWDWTVRLWDLTIIEEKEKLERHDDTVTTVAFSPDGQTIASGSRDRTIRLWDTRTGAQKQTLEGHNREVTAVTFSPDGRTIASGSRDRTIRLWDTRTGEQKQTLEGHGRAVTVVTFSPDGQTIASGSLDWTVTLWDTWIGEKKQTFKGHNDAVTAVTFSPDCQTIASGSLDQTIWLWNAKTGEQLYQIQSTSRPITALDFGKDATSLKVNTAVFDLGPSISQPMLTVESIPATNLELRDQWIRLQDQDILWLPYDFRGTCSTLYRDLLVVGQATGTVSFYGFYPPGIGHRPSSQAREMQNAVSLDRSTEAMITSVPTVPVSERRLSFESPFYSQPNQITSENQISVASDARTPFQQSEESTEIADPALNITTLLNTGNPENLYDILETHFEAIATGPWLWLTELADLGYSRFEIAEFLLDKREQSPWIYYEPWVTAFKMPDYRFHVKECVHAGFYMRRDTAQGGLPSVDHSLASTHTLRRTILSLCGLAGVLPDNPDRGSWNGAVEFENESEAVVSFNFDEAELPRLLDRLKNAVARVCTALAIIQEANGCCNKFTVLCKNPGESFAELQSMHLRDVIRFHEALQRASLDDMQSWQNCAYAARMVLQCLPLSGMISMTAEIATANALDRLHICALAAQLMCLALVCYSQAHCGPIDPFFLEHELTAFSLLGVSTNTNDKTYIRARLERLTCLDAMLNAPVMVFSLSAIPLVASGPLDVLASADDILDTWGPGRATMSLKDGRKNAIASVSLRGGVIYAVGPNRFHWEKYENLHDRGSVLDWDPGAVILVGALIDVNLVCFSSEISCLNAFRENWLPLGTHAPYWREQEREAGLQAGQYMTAVFNVVWDKIPGQSLKAKLINDLKHGNEYLAFLNALCGLRVSFCSGLAKRVRMRDLLAELMPIYVRRKLPEPCDWPKLINTYRVVEILAAKDVTSCESMFRRMTADDLCCFNTFWALALEIIMALEKTGLQPTGDYFTMGLIPSLAEEPMRGISCKADGSNFWTKALRDTESCATFAYLTWACFQMSGRGCRNARRQWHGQVLLLETEVHRQFNGFIAEKLPDTWVLKNDEVYSLGGRDAERNAALCAKVVRRSPSEDPQLLIQRSLMSRSNFKRHLQKRNRHHYLQERLGPNECAHRAFVTSTVNTAFSFN